MDIEVLTLMFHFVISLGVLVAYLYTVVTGHPDETLRDLLMVIGGYWFGMAGKGLLTKKGDTTDVSK